jgi:hypothetical protein
VRHLITLTALASIACLSGCQKPVQGVAPDAKFRPLIPPDTKILADIQLDKLKSTPLYQRHQKELELPMLDAASERLGVDPVRDLSDVLIAWSGKRPLLLATGRFKPAQMQEKLINLGAPRSSYKTFQLFGDSNNALTFLDNGLAVEGPTAQVQKTIDLRNNGAQPIPEELAARLRTLSKTDQVWVVSSSGLPFMDMPMRSDVTSALSNIVNFITGATGGLQLDTGAHIRIDLSCISDEGARRVHDALRGGIGFARLSTKNDQQQLLRAYDAINVDQDKALVHVSADFSGDLVDQLLAQWSRERNATSR